jgi:hypothetical protein
MKIITIFFYVSDLDGIFKLFPRWNMQLHIGFILCVVIFNRPLLTPLKWNLCILKTNYALEQALENPIAT